MLPCQECFDRGARLEARDVYFYLKAFTTVTNMAAKEVVPIAVWTPQWLMQSKGGSIRLTSKAPAQSETHKMNFDLLNRGSARMRGEFGVG